MRRPSSGWSQSHTNKTGKENFFKKYLFIYYFIYLFWLCRVVVEAHRIFAAACRLLSCSMHVGSSSLTRDQIQVPCTGSMESYPLGHQGSLSKENLNQHRKVTDRKSSNQKNPKQQNKTYKQKKHKLIGRKFLVSTLMTVNAVHLERWTWDQVRPLD